MQAELFSVPDQPAIELGEPLSLQPGELMLWPGYLGRGECGVLMERLRQRTEWKQESISLYGQVHALPRLTAWHGEPGAAYRYSGILQQPSPWSVLLQELRARLELRCAWHFNSVLLNLYRNGNDTVAWHADDEPELGPAPVIASVSLGATRRFRLRLKADHARTIALDLEGGSLLLMRGRVQQLCEHSVARTSRTVEERINLTFRRISNAPCDREAPRGLQACDGAHPETGAVPCPS